MKKIVFYLFALISLPQLIASTIDVDTKEKAEQFSKNQPVRFLENKGQMTDMANKPVPFVLFKAEASGMNMYITEKGITYVFIRAEEEEHEEKNKMSKRHEEKIEIEWNRVDMNLIGASIRKENIIKEGPSTDFKQYFLAHCPNGITDVRSYEKITIKEIYHGIDWVLYNSNNKGFKYDFIVHPGANATDIAIVYNSQKPIKLNEQGELEIKTKLGNLTENKPYSYIQETNIEIKSTFKISEKHIERDHYETTVSIELFNNENLSKQTIVIDPQLVWGTFWGGPSNEQINSIDIDPSGNIYVTGYTISNGFPVKNLAGSYFVGTTGGGIWDAFIGKFDNASGLIWSTYYGGNGNEEGKSIELNVLGDNIYVTGYTTSTNFPVKNLAGAYNQALNAGSSDAFMLHFNSSGVLIWATYFGGDSYDISDYITVDPSGNIYITGNSSGGSFPMINLAGAYSQNFAGGINSSIGDAFIAKFNTAGVLTWSTFFGGSLDDSAKGIITNSSGNVFITGSTNSKLDFPLLDLGGGSYFQSIYGGGTGDAFIASFSSAGVLVWSTFYGGNNEDVGIDILFKGNLLYVAAQSRSNNSMVVNSGGFYQATNGSGGAMFDGMVLKFNSSLTLIWATYFGGIDNDVISSITADSSGNVYITGSTQSNGKFPLIDPGCTYYQNIYGGSFGEVFIAQFNAADVLIWSTYYGGNKNEYGNDIGVNASGCLIVGGMAASTSGFTIKNLAGAYNQSVNGGANDAFLLKFCSTPITVTATNNGPITCLLTTVTLNGTSPGNTMVWNGGSLSNVANPASVTAVGIYTVTATDGTNGCTSTTTISVSSNTTPPTLTASSNGNLTCTKTSATLTGISAGNAMVWNGGALINATNPATIAAAGIYTLTVTDAINGCIATQSITVTQSPSLTAGISTVSSSCGTPSGSATVNVTTGTSPYTYSWSNGASSITTATSNQALLSSNTYTVTITDANNCSTTTSITINNTNSTVNAAVTTNITSNTISEGESIVLSAGGGTSYTWTPNNSLSCATCPVTIANPTTTTTYTLIVKDNIGCADTTDITINVKKPCTGEEDVFIANVFSPNNDGKNDILLIQGNGLTNIYFSIYDRWGNLMFETRDQAQGWDGNVNGNTANAGTYVYYLKATCKKTLQEIILKGNVSVLK